MGYCRSLFFAFFLLGAAPCGVDMSLSNPPAGWVMATGTWGVDATTDDTAGITGGTAIVLQENVATLITLVSADYIPIEAGRSYRVGMMWQDSVATTGDDGLLYVDLYDSAFAATRTVTAYDGPSAAADTWEERTATLTATSTEVWAKIRFGYDGVSSGAAYFDRVWLQREIPSWEAYRSSTQSITGSTPTIVAFNAGSAVDASLNTSTGVVTILTGGVYVLNARARLLFPADQTYMWCRFDINGTTYRYGSDAVFYAPPGGASYGYMASVALTLAAGDTVSFTVYHDDSTARSIANTNPETYFTGVRVE